MHNTKNLFDPSEGSFPRIAPFALFMAFIAIQEGMRYIGKHGILAIPEDLFLYLYPVKTVSVGLLLFCYRKSYTEITRNCLTNIGNIFTSVFTGIIVLVLWINMDWSWATVGTSSGFNPSLLSDNVTRYTLIFSRILGAAVVVPIMEEIFWRSWLLRYIISSDFQSVEIGKFTLPSFLIGTIMFGLEHNLWLAGIMAGAIYTLLLYRTKSITLCIVAHGLTNFLLGIYVLQTARWEFW
ncbi:CAAX prenyl protease-related protein [Geobacter pelophilus]|uniref:CAAX prenyl protease-related protein n=1 Tax=Geoanaerobacter pelophilus TaxID=60036 RepID=A0AAW4L3X0_9BACT|nr:CAAX prenyl protease-related protein [Geoanaerobacter pelophilus]MBT0662739.1 CAAX prenyl protease-related protein [Geoanaerobacter pelophilus]